MPAKYSEEKWMRVFMSRIRKAGPDDCWLWTAARFPDGYGCMKRNGINVGAHRLMWAIVTGLEQPTGTEVRHTCDNPLCCNPEHLILGTRLDNQNDKAVRGRASRLQGTAQSQAKLTEAIVLEIRRKYRRRLYGYKSLAREYGVAESLIRRIIIRKNWRHV